MDVNNFTEVVCISRLLCNKRSALLSSQDDITELRKPHRYFVAFLSLSAIFEKFHRQSGCSLDSLRGDRLVGLVVKASALGAEDPGFESRLRRDFSGSSHTSDLKIGTPVATLPGPWHYRVSVGTGLPSVSIL